MIYHFKKTIEYLLDRFVIINFKSMRDYISCHNNHFGKYILVPVGENCTLNQVIGEYKFFDLRKDDVVLDIGANIGGFSMLVCESVKHVYAVEPLFADILNKNVLNNSIKNITVLNIGLGLNQYYCRFMSRDKIIECKSLSEIIQMCGGKVDFLKCDCEGGEWTIQPHELKGIRRIEAEIHSFCDEKLFDFVDMLHKCRYIVDITDNNGRTMMIHATLNEGPDHRADKK